MKIIFGISETTEHNEKYVKIIIGKNEFRLRETNQGELVINKYNGDDGNIHITPSVSNEIKLT